MVIEKKCPMCGKESRLQNVEQKQLEKFEKKEALIQHIFPAMHPYDREFLITGLCVECQKRIFMSKPEQFVDFDEMELITVW